MNKEEEEEEKKSAQTTTCGKENRNAEKTNRKEDIQHYSLGRRRGSGKESINKTEKNKTVKTRRTRRTFNRRE